MERRLRKVKTTMSIHAHRRTLELLDGEYASIHHGRSHDFDDLREYQPGDEVKDIDWKATARSHVPLIKRYIASRQHNLLLVVDSGRNMAATAESGESKRELAILVAGVLGYLATRHGDRVALLMGDAERREDMPEGGSESHLERILRRVDHAIAVDGPRSSLVDVLEHAVRRMRRRSLIVVIADDLAYTHDLDVHLGRLHTRHEVLWVSIGDADLMARAGDHRELVGVDTGVGLPAFLRRDRGLRRAFDAESAARRERLETGLRSLGIASVRVASSATAIGSLFRLLERHRRARR
ncbi:DUF58 domain-containing protein [Agrococcus carbonis]|uniref:DUF58 domain-containing protein n=1 Tax=Agrococcus carbonis TaxID=684552 RepID=A0A1H1SBS2_9MICO|nr:DUF58 domain-containing protein [Agrococcus carbonis]SDS45425.1 Protein of unknown function DUF58 [Agrococcus carbonis]